MDQMGLREMEKSPHARMKVIRMAIGGVCDVFTSFLNASPVKTSVDSLDFFKNIRTPKIHSQRVERVLAGPTRWDPHNRASSEYSLSE